MQRNFVNAAGLFMFASDVSPDFIDDVLTSHLFYQLAASGNHDPFDDGEGWRREYLGLMVAFGQEASRTEVHSIVPEGPDSLWSAIKNALNMQVSSGLLRQAEAVFTHLQTGDDAALKLLEENVTQPSTRLTKAPFPAVATEDEPHPRPVVLQLVFVDKAPFLTQVFISFKTISSVPTLSILPLIAQNLVVDNLELNVSTTEFYADSYEDIKDTILERLGPRRSSLIIELAEVSV